MAQNYLVQYRELYGENIFLEKAAVQNEFNVRSNKDEIDAPSASETDFDSLEGFQLSIKDCTKCGLANGRTQVVFGTGNFSAKLMCIGEAPGFEEDKQGEPFVGAAGQLLDKILQAIGFARSEVYIANIVKCRPPNNRNPEPDEIASCLPYLRKQIEMIGPKLILALGRIAAQTLLGAGEPVGKLRTGIHQYEGIPVYVTYHPAALLREQSLKHHTWKDVQKLRCKYDELVGDKPVIAFN